MSEQITTTNVLDIKGYTPHTESVKELVNRNKEVEESVLKIIDELKNIPEVDKRWLAIGQTNLELAFMALNRSIFKPERLKV